MKGQLSISFNWIFILLIGGVLVGFFMNVINTQEKQATQEGAQKLTENLDTVFTVLSQESNTYNQFNIPNAEIDFYCEEDYSEYLIQKVGPVPTTYDIIFTPTTLQGEKILTWTLDWSTPFEVAVFTFMINDRTAFIFVNATTATSAQKKQVLDLYTTIPPIFSARNIQEEQIATLPKGFERYVFITNKEQIDDIKASVEEEFVIGNNIHFRGFTAEKGINAYGDIVFIDNNKEKDYAKYYRLPSLIGALFAENKEFYDCTMNKAWTKMRVLTEIYGRRSEMIQEEIYTGSCYDFFVTLGNKLANINEEQNNYPALYQTQQEIEELYQNTKRGYKCPYLY